MIDRRLLGSWKSDKRRTLRELRKFKGFPEKTIQLLGKKIYGRLIHRWERTTLKTSMGGAFSSQKYSVLAKDEGSVALWIAADPESWLEEKDHILHLRFDGPDWYWIPVLCFRHGLSREWFKRLEDARGISKK
jgi:hypothetical protein